MRLADATAARQATDWLIETGLYRPLRAVLPTRPMVKCQPRDLLDLATLRVLSVRPTAPSSDS